MLEVRRIVAMERAINDFIAALSAQRNASANTICAYGTDLRQLLDFLTRRDVTDWRDMTAEHVAGFVTHLGERRYASTSVARKIAALKTFTHYLMRKHLLEVDPTLTLTAPKVKKDHPRVLSPEQAQRFFQHVGTSTAAGQRDFAMLHCLASTGMRVTELVTTNVDDLDLARGHIRCRGRGGRIRTLPLSLAAQHALAVYLGDGRRDLAHSSEENALFVNHHGQRLTRQGFWLIMKQYARSAGITQVTPHTLRHSFALDMLGKGADLRTVQSLLGHANISTTLVYAHMSRAKHEESLGEQGEDTPERVTPLVMDDQTLVHSGAH
jgi:integrase/recombinase XerD